MQGYLILAGVVCIFIMAMMVFTQLIAKELGAKNATWLSSIFAYIIMFCILLVLHQIQNLSFIKPLPHHAGVIFFIDFLLNASVIAIILKMTYLRALAVFISSVVLVNVLAVLGYFFVGLIGLVIFVFKNQDSLSKFLSTL